MRERSKFANLHLPFILLGLLAVLPYAHSHGCMSWPRQRGLLGRNIFGLPVLPGRDKAQTDNCPHCLNGGGVGVISKYTPNGRWTPYEPTNRSFPWRDDHGMNGDPKGVRDHAVGGKYTAGVYIGTYEEGDFMDMEIAINAHHNGYFLFWICDLEGCGDRDISKRCFMNGYCKRLVRVPHPSCESGNDKVCGPIDPNDPGRWVMPCKSSASNVIYGGRNKKMRYALPKGFTSNKAVVHWWWVTANSCNPPGFLSYKFPRAWGNCPGDGGASGGRNPVLGECGKGGAFPEEFWTTSEFLKVVKRGTVKGPKLQVFSTGKMNVESGQVPVNASPSPSPSGDDDDEEASPTPSSRAQASSSPWAGASPSSWAGASPSPSTAPPVMSPSPNGDDDEETSPTPSASTASSPSLSSSPLVSVSPVLAPSPTVSLSSVPSTSPTISFSGVSPVMTPAPGSPSSTSSPGMKASKYNLERYVKTYDTGKCKNVQGVGQLCQACMDLGCGVIKCWWCNRAGCYSYASW